MGRGRPKGSLNRPKEIIAAERAERENLPKRGRGRPAGSKNRPKIDITAEKNISGKHDVGYMQPEDGQLSRSCDRFVSSHPRTAEEKNFNARLIDHIMGIHEIAKHADRHDLVSLESCFIAYLKLCQKNGFSVLNISAYAAMGMNNDDFKNLARKDDPETREFCKRVRETCGMFRESLVEAGKLNPVIGIFWQRNYDGLRNDTEQIQNAVEQDDTYVNGSKSYREKYRNLLSE